MDFNLSKEQLMLQKSVQEYMRNKIVPIADEYDKKGPMSRQDAVRFLKDLIPFGYIGALVPEEMGGPGLSYVDSGLIMLELRKAYASLGGIAGITSNAAVAVSRCDSDMLKEKYLPQLLNADMIGCMALTEPDAGSDPSAIKTSARLEGNHYILNGTKMWISNGSIADIAIVACVDESKEGGDRDRIFRLLVDQAQSPFQTSEISKIGVKSFPTSELVFNNCQVPKENVIRMAGKNFDNIQRGLIVARCNAAVASVGIAEAALEAAVKHAKSRTQFGKVIGKFQMVQQLIAEMIIEVEAAKLLTFRAFKMLDEGHLCRKESSIAKAYATEIGWKVASKAMQVHGAYGLSTEYPLERYFRDARCYTFPDGTTQIQHLIIAREALGLSAVR